MTRRPPQRVNPGANPGREPGLAYLISLDANFEPFPAPTDGFIETVLTRREAGCTIGAGATEFARLAGAISFDLGGGFSGWDFDSSNGVSGIDFYSVALHELAHVLGIGTSDSWDNLVSGNQFTGANSVATYGGNVPLHSDDQHWSDSTMSLVAGSAILSETAMDFGLTANTQKLFTDLDWAALDDIGWDIAPVPLPPAAWLFGGALLGILAVGRRQAAST